MKILVPELLKIVSGGQTGVDRGALDAAIVLGILRGGWCPAGRRAEDGVIPARYQLEETPSEDYGERTEWNVRDADSTLIISPLPLSGGTLFTLECARRFGRPHLVVDPSDPEAGGKIQSWMKGKGIRILNVAGPRESSVPGICTRTSALLISCLAE